MKMLFETRLVAGGTSAYAPRRSLKMPTLHVTYGSWGKVADELRDHVSFQIWHEVGGPLKWQMEWGNSA